MSGRSNIESYHFDDVKAKVNRALKDFLETDSQLLELSANEQAATHRIAGYLQKYFVDWHVDCEYNRKNAIPKKLQGELVKPDILVHRRNTNDNLLCIEAKKLGGSIDDDKKKLCRFTNPTGEYKYRFGLMMILSLDAPYKIDCEWYRDGNAI
jgi:cytoplasmic iron level regulating protein YaaA (DUF328/UPF0246 family)